MYYFTNTFFVAILLYRICSIGLHSNQVSWFLWLNSKQPIAICFLFIFTIGALHKWLHAKLEIFRPPLPPLSQNVYTKISNLNGSVTWHQTPPPKNLILFMNDPISPCATFILNKKNSSMAFYYNIFIPTLIHLHTCSSTILMLIAYHLKYANEETLKNEVNENVTDVWLYTYCGYKSRHNFYFSLLVLTLFFIIFYYSWWRWYSIQWDMRDILKCIPLWGIYEENR